MSIKIDSEERFFQLDTKNTSYAMCVMYGKYLCHAYYGKKTKDLLPLEETLRCDVYSFAPFDREIGNQFSVDTVPLEYSGYNTGDFRTHSIAAEGKSGSAEVGLIYSGYRLHDNLKTDDVLPRSQRGAGVETLEIILKDPCKKLRVNLYYTVFYEDDIIARHAEIINYGSSTLKILKCASGSLDIYADREYEILSLHGTYNYEFKETRTPVRQGKYSYGSNEGSTGHRQNPFLMLKEISATETAGEVYGFNLLYSGNFCNETELSDKKIIRIVSGIQPEQFQWTLKKGERFYTPEWLLSYSDCGMGKLSANFHAHILHRIIPREFRAGVRPMLINTWETFLFDVRQDLLTEIAAYLPALGIDTIVLDDGWFTRRKNDKAGLGDWEIDTVKFPDFNGMVEKIQKFGLSFGIWFEPEMVSEDSELYRTHPEWVLGIKQRVSTLSRNQLVLDMTNPLVIEYLYAKIESILRLVPVSYLKWDMNRYLSEVGSFSLPRDRQRETAHRYILGVYRLMSMVRAGHPDLLIENCSGGGGRFDLGMLYFSPQIWLSDNTSPAERAKMQYAASYAYPLSCISAHVTDGTGGGLQQKTPLDFRIFISANGVLSYEFDIRKLNEYEKQRIKEYNTYYKEQLFELILNGRLYRLKSPIEDERLFAQIIVSPLKDKALFTIAQIRGESNNHNALIRLKGLDPAKKYCEKKSGKIYNGDYLMNAGLKITGLYGSSARQFLFIETGV